MTQTLTREELGPTQSLAQQATMNALGVRVGASEVESFLEKLASASVPAPIGATADVKIAVWGKVQVTPDGQPWLYDHTIWGGPAYFGSSVGFMYTAYDSWDAFFQDVTSVHVQGVDVGGGLLQANWFRSDGLPVGQFNGVAAGGGLVEAGGSGKWEHT
ncbi:hypothetical protein [Streptomyces peucetius]|uniref:Uncharacterized protein n=1 Tax=Streptomyces peucetius TaxID=1950 RepID=A0ABY6I926_STRPE|nr:hypothetical protein [Streptomyces peucetius]UYQ63204.1 hypothetical protein OGH68_18155 [Streptomyces peucetius]